MLRWFINPNTYRIMSYMAVLVIKLALNVRARYGKEDISRRTERLGYSNLSRPMGSLLWIHAASVGEFKSIIPIIDLHFENSTFPINLIKELANMGFLGIGLPKKYGGGGMNNIIYGLVCQEIERGDSAIRSFISVQNSLVMYPIITYGSEHQKQHWKAGHKKECKKDCKAKTGKGKMQ